MKFYLQIDGKRYLLPVNPSEIEIDKSSNNSSNEVVALGEITQIGPESLKEVSIESFFPKSKTSNLVAYPNEFVAQDKFVDLLDKAQSAGKLVRLTITTTKVNILATIENFKYSYKDASGDIYYSIELKQYREYGAKYMTTVKKKVSEAKKVAKRPKPQTKKITKGCKVICNGRLHRDSYGSGPGLVEKNATRIVNFIAPGRKFPYHVTLLNGGWRGWVDEKSVKRI